MRREKLEGKLKLNCYFLCLRLVNVQLNELVEIEIGNPPCKSISVTKLVIFFQNPNSLMLRGLMFKIVIHHIRHENTKNL